jgi:serine/threonine-protein kinase
MHTHLTAEELRAQLETAIGDGYRLERELPAGGMSRLFLAIERSLNRRVVIKLLPPEYTSAVTAARFEREMTLTAHLQHPHILPILAAGTNNGLLYCITPYVEGESLRGRLETAGRLPIASAVQILREVADALARAHEAGVVHRDIKPENILMQGEHALLADFGVAHVLQSPTSGERLTGTGMSLGTVGYMAPEQLTGDANIDGRADIYALGVVGYEILSGQPPFAGKTTQALVGAHLMHIARPLSELRPDVPQDVADAIARALAKDRDDRFATAAELRDALGTTTAPRRRVSPRIRRRWALGAAVAAVLVVAAAITWRSVSSRVNPAVPPVGIRIAVLPFDNLGDSANAYFAEGVSDAVRDKLVAIRGMQVIASTSSGEYRHTRKPLRQIASELGVRYVLTGKVRWIHGARGAADSLVIHPTLNDAESNIQAWGEPFDAPRKEVFRIQGDIARKVAERLQGTLTAESRQQLAQGPTINLDAYDAYLRARALERTAYSPTTYARLVAAYQEAVRRDPNFALAWAALGRAHIKAYTVAAPPPPGEGESARRAGERALQLSPELANGHIVMARYYASVTNNRDSALTQLREALRLSPTDAGILAEVGYTEVHAGEWADGIPRLEESFRLDPRDVGTAIELGTDYLRLRRYDYARRMLDRALALEPTNLVAIKQRAMVELAEGDLDGARRIIRGADAAVDSAAFLAYLTSVDPLPWLLDPAQQRTLLSLTPESYEGMRAEWGRAKGIVYASRGDRARGRAYLDSALAAADSELAAAPNSPIILAFRAVLLAHMGRHAEAIANGESAARLFPITEDSFLGPWVRHMLAQTYVLVGENDKAVDVLESLLRVPHYLSPAWLKIDPTYAPLRGFPRFDRLVSGQFGR